MRKFTEMKFFYLLENISIPDADLKLFEGAYDEFASSLFSDSENPGDLTALYNQLSYTKAELDSLHKKTVPTFKEAQTPIKSYLDCNLLMHNWN